jgi:hypothetical protein
MVNLSKIIDGSVIILRHNIVSVSLAMTACVAFMPIKAYAATLTVIPVGEIPKRPGDSIEFSFVLTPAPSSVVTIRNLFLGRDTSELSSPTGGIPLVVGSQINTPTTFTSRHTVLTPVKDGIRDLWASVLYDESDPLGMVTRFQASASAGDVVPVSDQGVPEPLTILGAVTALGYGAILKRKSSKKTVS